MKPSLHEQATKLRTAGWSYNIIASKLNVGKSTLSHWLREVSYTPNETVRKRIREGPAKSATIRHQKKLQSIHVAKHSAAVEIGQPTKRDLWMLGLGLYMGEGAKLYESVRLINSDPDVIRLAMKWFREICGVKDNNFRVDIHLYPDNPKKETLRFWSKVTQIPIAQFGKTQIDRRANKSGMKKRKLPYGTAHITVRSLGDPNCGVLLHRRIIGWIEKIHNDVRV